MRPAVLLSDEHPDAIEGLDVSEQWDTDDQGEQCPMCLGDAAYIGALGFGSRAASHYRCGHCGWTFGISH